MDDYNDIFGGTGSYYDTDSYGDVGLNSGNRLSNNDYSGNMGWLDNYMKGYPSDYKTITDSQFDQFMQSGTDPYADWSSITDPSNLNIQKIIDAITKGVSGAAGAVTGTSTGLPWLDSIADLWATKNIVDQYGRNEDWNDMLGKGRDMAGQMQELINQRDPVKLSALQQMMIAGGNDMYSNANQNLNSINQRLTGNQQSYSPYQLPGAV
jgi:hypothetical protein